MPETIPYLRPDHVKDELAKAGDSTWPMVATVELPDGQKVVAHAQMQLGRGRRRHVARLTLEFEPSRGQDAGRELLRKAIAVAQDWFNIRRLEAQLVATADDSVALFQAAGFVQEVRLSSSMRIAGELQDELVVSRLSGDLASKASKPLPLSAGPAAPQPSSPFPARRLRIRSGANDDWETYHAIWSQPSVYWGTLQIPYPSADRNRERIQENTPPNLWSLAVELDGKMIGTASVMQREHNRSHVGHIGMMVDHDCQGRGVGKALMEGLIDLTHGWLGLSRLQLEVFVDNARAIGLYQRYGFKQEGILRAYAFRDGEYVDTLVMGRIGGGSRYSGSGQEHS